MWLDPTTFTTILASTPLVSIDLIVEDAAGQILLGQRTNRPAQGYWFVPGGRILKNETLDSAFERLTRDELGIALPRSEARLLDVYEHFYSDSVFGAAEEGPSTHYVVLGYHLRAGEALLQALPREQHSAYRWSALDAAQQDPVIHAHSRAYVDTLLSRRTSDPRD